MFSLEGFISSSNIVKLNSPLSALGIDNDQTRWNSEGEGKHNEHSNNAFGRVVQPVHIATQFQAGL
jgi:hypothetical protein